MPCYCPLTAYRTREGGITFQRNASLSGCRLELPCGQCVGCRLERSRQWAMRCLHEKRFHNASCFATLTYRNETLPPGGTLVKRDLQLFFKRLRKCHQVRFYACGEYGEVNGRPHYHALIFGYDFPDKLLFTENGRGDRLYTSGELASYWKLGHCLVGDVTFDSAAYVARYVMKKVTGERASDHYCVVDGDGVCFDRIPEYTVMSRRPGIGSDYYERFGQEVRDHDSVVINAREVRPPRFYDTRTAARDPALFDLIRKKRRKTALLFKADNTPERRRVKERLCELRLEALQRRV